MRFGKFEEEIETGNEVSHKEIEESPENNEKEFESDGIHYRVESLEQKFHDLFQSEPSVSLKERQNRVLEEAGMNVTDARDELDQLQDQRTDRKLEAYLKELDESTPENLSDSLQEVEDNYSDEELEDIWENDPGYVNENAFKKLPSEGEDEIQSGVVNPHGKYMEMGFHNKDIENYGKDAVDGTVEENYVLEPGTVIERWGAEDGSYLTDPDTDFDDLHLNVSEGKLSCQRYEVLKPLLVEKSEIADQPFDESKEGEERNPAIQYKSSIYVEDLVDLGILRRIEPEEEN